MTSTAIQMDGAIAPQKDAIRDALELDFVLMVGATSGIEGLIKLLNASGDK